MIPGNCISILNNITHRYITKVHLLIYCASVVIVVQPVRFEARTLMSTVLNTLVNKSLELILWITPKVMMAVKNTQEYILC